MRLTISWETNQEEGHTTWFIGVEWISPSSKEILISMLYSKYFLIGTSGFIVRDFSAREGDLEEKAVKKVIEKFDERLKVTVKHRDLKRSITYKNLILLECYKLEKHLIGEKEYQPFQMWW